MRVSTALRIASIIILAIYWRRAEILGHPLHVGAYSWIGLITILAVGLAIAAGVYVAAGHSRRQF
jgi:cadmium resistance protein CadD (predicted permease)